MKKYYIVLNEEQKGAFTIEELSKFEINQNTPIWYEGISEWKNAGSIEELKDLFPKEITPPVYIKNTITKENIIPPIYETKNSNNTSLVKKDNKNRNFIIGGSIILLLLIMVFLFEYSFFSKNNIQKTVSSTYSGQDTTDVYVDSTTALVDYEAVERAEAETIEQERVDKENRMRNEARIQEILVEMNNNDSYIQEYKNQLNQAKKFKLLRTAEEREFEINNLLEDISILENDNRVLEEEMIKINPDWGSDT